MATAAARAGTPAGVVQLEVTTAGSLPAAEVLARVGPAAAGLAEQEAARRLRAAGPNAVRSHRTRAAAVLARQLRSPLLILLTVTATASFFVGERSDAVIIGVILLASVGLGFGNEYRAEKAAAALHSQIRHRCVVLRDGHPGSADVTELVPGDVVDLQLGEVVPADLRLLAATGLECDESVLTGESLPAGKSAEPVPAGRNGAGRPDQLRADGHRGAGGLGYRRGHRHRRASRVRPDRARARGTPA